MARKSEVGDAPCEMGSGCPRWYECKDNREACSAYREYVREGTDPELIDRRGDDIHKLQEG